MITIEYFGPSKDFTKKTSEQVSDIITLQNLYDHLTLTYSREFQSYVQQNCGITLNYEYIDRNQDIRFKDGDEICIIPPVSSG